MLNLRQDCCTAVQNISEREQTSLFFLKKKLGRVSLRACVYVVNTAVYDPSQLCTKSHEFW